MIKIAVTGPSGSGKSTLIKILADKGYPVIDCDIIAHQLQNPGELCYLDLVEAFGTDILNEDNTINRKILAKKAFSDKENTVKLNSITHHHILDKVNSLCIYYQGEGSKCVFIEAGALFESGLDKECNRIIMITSSRDNLISRICSRDGIEEEAANLRLDAQKDISFIIEKSHLILFNNYKRAILDLFADLIISKIGVWGGIYEQE